MIQIPTAKMTCNY